MSKLILALMQLLGCMYFLILPFDAGATQYIGNPDIAGVFNVMNFGAKGDGTTDDTAAIQNAEIAAEAVISDCGQSPGSSCAGEVIFPCGSYRIHTGPIIIQGGPGAMAMPKWRGECGATTAIESGPPYAGATLFSDVPSNYIVSVVSSGSEAPVGPRFINLGFAGNGSGSRSAGGISINNVMRGIINESSFRNLGVGIDMQGAGDDSGWVIRDNMLLRNLTSIDFEASSTGGGNNVISSNQFDEINTNDVMVLIHAGNHQIRINDNHFACVPGMQTAISAAGMSINITNNNFENCEPAILLPQNTTMANNGRGYIIMGNAFDVADNAVSVTCTTSNNSTAVTGCSSTSGLTAGMIVTGGIYLRPSSSGPVRQAHTITEIHWGATAGEMLALITSLPYKAARH